jgi:hypothetical protein
MSTFIESVKSRVVGIAATVTVLGTIVGGVFAVESRYAKAADIDDVKQQQVQIYSNMKIQQDLAVDSLRRQTLEDRLFELRLKERPSQPERALIERYQDQLRELDTREDMNKRMLRNIQ